MPRTVPSVALQNPGNLVTASVWNTGPKALGDFYTAPPIFRGWRSTNFSTSSGVYYAQPFNNTDVDSDSGHSNVTNNTRYTCQVAGWYLVSGFVSWTAVSGTFDSYATVAKNGSAYTGSQQVLLNFSGDTIGLSTEAFVNLTVGDYVEIWGQQNSGGALSTSFFSDMTSSMNVIFVHS